MADKLSRYQALIKKARASYPTYDPSDEGDKLRLYWCEYCKEINLWTYWQGRGNLNAKIMLVGQDWGSPWDESLHNTMQQIQLANQGSEYDYLSNNPSVTDNRLIQLFREIGYDITQGCPDLFFTNLVLGYRNKGTSGGYKNEWAGHDKGYFKELADIVEPKVILCLGRSTFEGVLSAFERKFDTPIKGMTLLKVNVTQYLLFWRTEMWRMFSHLLIAERWAR